MPVPVYYTADMVRAMPDDGNRYEVVYGELLVTPALRLWHQELVVRLLSPSTAGNDRFLKRLRYREAGVPLYWVVDGDTRAVEIWTPADDFPRIERERLVWRAANAAEAFTLDLGELFRPL